jgi:hypothetical protein
MLTSLNSRIDLARNGLQTLSTRLSIRHDTSVLPPSLLGVLPRIHEQVGHSAKCNAKSLMLLELAQLLDDPLPEQLRVTSEEAGEVPDIVGLHEVIH